MSEVLLVAVDFESASQAAVALAQELAVPLRAEVVLIHVYQLPVYTYPGLESAFLPTFQAEVAEGARHALEDLAQRLGGLRAISREGDPATEILAAAEEIHPRMVLLGTHGRRGVAHLFLGSVAERVIRRAQVPVLTVRVPKGHESRPSE